MNTTTDLLKLLFVELCQTEESAIVHPRTEAERLHGTPAAPALLAVTAHAERTRPELEALAKSEDLEMTTFGAKIGDALSVVRDFVIDRSVSREKSYRGTLIGMHHGVDVVRLVRHTALAAGRPRIVAFCEAWLAVRPALIERCADELAWFAHNPEQAMQRATRELSSPARSLSPRASGEVYGGLADGGPG